MCCLRALFAQIGCLVLVVAAVVLGWTYRRPLYEMYRRYRGETPTVVYTMPEANRSQRAAEQVASLARRGGPAFVDLTAGEVAAILNDELVRVSRQVFDSVQVALDSNTVLVKGVLDLSQLPTGLLGPLASSLSGRVPLEAGGALSAADSGAVVWIPGQLRIKNLPLPSGMIPPLLRALGVGVVRGGVVLPGLRGVGDVRVLPGMIRLYRPSNQ